MAQEQYTVFYEEVDDVDRIIIDVIGVFTEEEDSYYYLEPEPGHARYGRGKVNNPNWLQKGDNVYVYFSIEERIADPDVIVFHKLVKEQDDNNNADGMEMENFQRCLTVIR